MIAICLLNSQLFCLQQSLRSLARILYQLYSLLSSVTVVIVFLSLDLLLYTPEPLFFLSLWTFIWVPLGALNALCQCKVYNLYDRNVCEDVARLPIIIKTHPSRNGPRRPPFAIGQ
jgi:hypothetical protein